MTEAPAPRASRARILLTAGIAAILGLAIGATAGYLARGPEVSELEAQSAYARDRADDVRAELEEVEGQFDARTAELDAREAEIASAPKPSDPKLDIALPEGYPQVVDISAVPEHMRISFEGTGTGQAVAVAPGLWAPLTPGATPEDAVNARRFDGFCASKESFEREYLAGDSTSGSCW
ncbi:hypothetical protein MUN78_07155 [Leucobacter allii]|uniref:Uncharacterized protein n=1 Tax=Leucobacter allii TaxID=2932247 RepID=A0ABY4FQM3_9MICO|nr:hypothetical protein [Leucobacter allii]UOQ58595.1 hypothetical protein MUN78_07155 [Leucobacter allii]